MLKQKEEFIKKRAGAKQTKFKSNTKVERAMSPLESMTTYATFIKKRKLVLFIDKETDNLVSFKKSINKFDFNGTVKYYKST